MSDDTPSHVRVSHLYDELLLRYCIHSVFRSMPAVTVTFDHLPFLISMPQSQVHSLTFDLWSQKVNQHIYEPIHLWPKLLGFWDMVFARFSGHCLLWPWPLTLWPQNIISTSTDTNASATKTGWNSVHRCICELDKISSRIFVTLGSGTIVESIHGWGLGYRPMR